jgi:glucose-6-phosphate 1-dehydrogenase
MPHDDFRAMATEAINEFSRRKPDPKVLDALLETCATSRDVRRRQRLHDAVTTLDEFDERAGEPLNRAFYLSTAPGVLPGDRRGDRRRRARRRSKAEVRCIIEKPFGRRWPRRRSSTVACCRCSTSSRSSASTTTSARRPSRT